MISMLLAGSNLQESSRANGKSFGFLARCCTADKNALLPVPFGPIKTVNGFNGTSTDLRHLKPEIFRCVNKRKVLASADCCPLVSYPSSLPHAPMPVELPEAHAILPPSPAPRVPLVFPTSDFGPKSPLPARKPWRAARRFCRRPCGRCGRVRRSCGRSLRRGRRRPRG